MTDKEKARILDFLVERHKTGGRGCDCCSDRENGDPARIDYILHALAGTDWPVTEKGFRDWTVPKAEIDAQADIASPYGPLGIEVKE